MVHAQSTDAGTLLRDIERGPAPPLPSKTPPMVQPQPAPPASAAPQVHVNVSSFRLRGVTLLPEADLQVKLERFKGRELTFAELQQAADAVAEAYRAKGYLVRALLPQQDLQGGVVQINVVEARIGAMRIDRGPSNGEAVRLKDSTIRSFMTARSNVGDPVNTDNSQRAINLLNDLPGVNASAVLEPGAKDGESTLVIRAHDQPLTSGLLQIDNSGVASTGRIRATALGSLDDPLGIGDQVSVGSSFSAHSQYGRLAYALPIGSDGWRASAAFSDLHYGYSDSVTGRYTGFARTWEGGVTYPLHRANDWNLNLGANLDAKAFNNDNALNDVSNNLNNKTSHSLIGLASGNAFDTLGGNGYTQFITTGTLGRLNLGGNPADLAADQAINAPQRNGSYSKGTLFISRLQSLTPDNTLYLSLTGQMANKNLDSSEKIGAGGPGAVRAYPAGEANGDEGFIATIEARRRVSELLQFSVFYDGARIRRDRRATVVTPARNNVSLQGIGIGASFGSPKTVLLTATVAARLGTSQLTTTDSDGNTVDPSGTNNRGRVWLTAIHTF